MDRDALAEALHKVDFPQGHFPHCDSCLTRADAVLVALEGYAVIDGELVAAGVAVSDLSQRLRAVVDLPPNQKVRSRLLVEAAERIDDQARLLVEAVRIVRQRYERAEGSNRFAAASYQSLLAEFAAAGIAPDRQPEETER